MAAWVPTDEGSALLAWYKGDAGKTLNGSAVSQWDDQSGNARHLTNSTAANQPLDAADYVDFNTTAKTLFRNESFLYGATGGYTLVAVVAAPAATTAILLGEGSSTNSSIIYAMRTPAASSPDMGFNARNAEGVDIIVNQSLGTTDVFLGTSTKKIIGLTDSQSVVTGYSGGTALESPISYTRSGTFTALNRFAVAGIVRSGTAPVVPQTGRRYDIIIFAGTDADRRKRAEGYLAHRHGLTADLPSDHPYKSAAPTTEVSASLTATEANDTLAATGTLAIKGVLGGGVLLTEAGARLLLEDGGLIETEAPAYTEADDTLEATGTLAADAISAVLDVTDADDTLAATATLDEDEAPSGDGGVGTEPRRVVVPLVRRYRDAEDRARETDEVETRERVVRAERLAVANDNALALLLTIGGKS